MTKLSNWTMRTGRADDRIDGWVIQTSINGREQREWISGCSQQTAFAIARRRTVTSLDWCRAYTIEDGQRVVLA